jgi:hypothetical protein
MNTHKTFYLNSRNNNHVNEYVNSDGGHYSDLISYTTRVASYNHKTGEMSVFGWYSKTTAKHINEFLNFYGFDSVSKKEMENYK